MNKRKTFRIRFWRFKLKTLDWLLRGLKKRKNSKGLNMKRLPKRKMKTSKM
jgi:hypothetical protein